MNEPEPRQPRDIMLLGAAALVLVVLSLVYEWKPDDAYISFSYAQNWLAGHGLVFNVGERVEGYTCFLWVVLSTVGMLLGIDIRWWSTALGIASGVGTLLVTWRLARDLLSPSLRGVAVLPAILVACYPVVGWWAGSGMETMLFTFLVTAALWRHVRDGARSVMAPVLAALASMTRPEGWLLSLLLCLDAARTGSRRDALRYTSTYMVLFAPYFGWRLWYYGDLLPNTFYAKVGYTRYQVWRGIVYLGSFLLHGRAVLLVLPAVLPVLLPVRRRLLAVYAFLTTYGLYVVFVGGDVFSFYRLYVPLVPVLAVLAVLAVATASAKAGLPSRQVSLATVLFVAVFLLSYVPRLPVQDRDLRMARFLSALQAEPCSYLRRHTTPADAIASPGIGKLKFCTGRRIIDMLGITDPVIAHQQVPTMGLGLPGHEKFDVDYVFAQRPKYILIPHPDAPFELDLAVFAAMWQHPALDEQYERHRFGYRRKDSSE